MRSELLRRIHVGERIRLPGGHVEAIDANHCPGALVLLFTLDDGRIVLHTGDFRYTPSMASSPPLATALAGGRRLSLLYLDNTYLEPRHTTKRAQMPKIHGARRRRARKLLATQRRVHLRWKRK